MADIKFAIVLFTGHVGSSWFTSELAKNDAAFQLGFEPIDQLTTRRVPAVPMLKAVEEGDCAHLLAEENRKNYRKFDLETFQSKLASEPPLTLVCFKSRVRKKFQKELFTDYITRMPGVFYALRRENLLKWAISNYKRNVLDISHLKKDMSIEEKRRPVNVDCAAVLKIASSLKERQDKLAKYIDWLKAQGREVDVLTYEDIIQPGAVDAVRADLYQKMGVEKYAVTKEPSFEKMTKDDLSMAVENYSEFADFFAKTDYAPFLEAN